ncbi:histone acetyltransferase type B subunit 2 [Trichomonascus vanleenenianus]|uniref:WD repeat RBAP46/RBAP48/MSI1 family protein n=1 Tax=Trichomonascus vanleenenianus TaxID=2268995 RepID=UPI003ECA7262
MTEQVPVDEAKVARYRVWKKNALYLYDSFVSAGIPWPSLTVQWMPDVESTGSFTKQRLLLGTQTNGGGDELLRIAEFKRERSKQLDVSRYDPEREEIGGYVASGTKIEISHKINHIPGEINRARYMPGNCDLIATMCSDSNVYVFDRTKYPLDYAKTFKSDIALCYHSSEGFGLSWNPLRNGILATGASDSAIALWDITKCQKDQPLKPYEVIKTHEGGVNELEWSGFDENQLISVSDDMTVQIHDTREPGSPIKAKGHSEGNTVSTNPMNRYLIATGTSDGEIQLWDSRKFIDPVMRIAAHEDSVTSLQWSPHHATVLASGSPDATVNVWDVAQPENERHIFKHGGHLAEVHDLSWNPAVEWEIASVAGDNILSIWKIAGTIVDRL